MVPLGRVQISFPNETTPNALVSRCRGGISFDRTNYLAVNVKTAQSLESFKAKLKIHLFKKCYKYQLLTTMLCILHALYFF